MMPDDEELARAAERVLARLRALAADLDDDGRMLLAALVAPGVALAYQSAGEDRGFDATSDDVGWSPDLLPLHLAAAIRIRGFRIVET